MATRKDWTNQKFNRLTFISISHKTKSHKLIWNIQCECGTISKMCPYDVVSGRIKTCGKCPKETKSKDWTGQRHGSLTFIKRYGSYPSGQMIWEAQCDCGNTCHTVPSNKSQSCGCSLGQAKSRQWCSQLGKKSRKYSRLESTARRVWQGYKKDGLDYDTFFRISQMACHYCGIKCSNTFTYGNGDTFTYNGLDRIDSSKGHTIDNIVPCCWECNKSKNDRSAEQFILHNKRIIEYQTNK